MNFEHLEEFNFELEPSKIATHPRVNATKLLVFEKQTSNIKIESKFSHIMSYLKRGDILVYNNAKVSKRKIFLKSKDTLFEVLFLEEVKSNVWQCLIKKSKKLSLNSTLNTFDSKFEFIFTKKEEEFCYLTCLSKLEESFFEFYGSIPLPPYMKRKAEKFDDIFYQTVFSTKSNSLASPTAGLHFSKKLIKDIEFLGVSFLDVTLEVGYGTFKPLREENFISKRLHEEKIFISPNTVQNLNRAKKNKNRIIAIGTTTLRVLESSFNQSLQLFEPKDEKTSIFITPDKEINSVDGLITNFHLPKSSLILLVSAFIGKDNILSCYKRALEKDFLFYSYGDAMFITE